MATGQIVEILAAVALVGSLCGAVVVLVFWVSHQRQRRPQRSHPKQTSNADVSNFEMQAIETQLGCVVAAADEGDLSKATCHLFGSACHASGYVEGVAVADARLRESPVRGEIFVTAADVGFRSARRDAAAAADDDLSDDDLDDEANTGNSSFFFYRSELPQALDRIPASDQFTCIAALSGHDYHAWYCPSWHPARSQLCPRCRPLISFRLQPGELQFHPGGVGQDVWVAASVDRLLAYSGPLSGLQRLPYGGSGGIRELSIQFGANFAAASAATADGGGGAVHQRDIADRAGVLLQSARSSMSSQLVSVSNSEFKFFLQAGLADPPSEVCSSNKFPGLTDSGEISDCDTSSSTVSPLTERSAAAASAAAAACISMKASSAVKWAAIGMQEVAGYIESSSPEEQQQQAAAAAVTDGLMPDVVSMQSQNSASVAGAAAAAAAASVPGADAAAASAATDMEYLRFMYSDASADDGEEEAGSGSGYCEAAPPSRSTEFYSADSTTSTSPVGSADSGPSTVDSSSGSVHCGT